MYSFHKLSGNDIYGFPFFLHKNKTLFNFIETLSIPDFYMTFKCIPSYFMNKYKKIHNLTSKISMEVLLLKTFLSVI